MLSVFVTLDQVASIISFGAYTAFTFVNLCVIKHYFIENKMRSLSGIFKYLLYPIIGVLFIAVMWVNISEMAVTLGIVWNVIGVILLAILTKGFKKPAPTLVIDKENEPDSLVSDINPAGTVGYK